MRRFFVWTLGLLGALLVAVLLVLIFPPTGWIAGKIEEAVAARTGYTLDIGDLDLDLLSGTPSATVSSVSVDGGQLPGLLDAARVRIAIDLGAVLGGEIVIDRLVAENADVRLLRTADGRTSWTPGAIEPANEPESEADGEFSLPTIRQLRIEDVDVLVDDEISDTEAALAVQAAGSTLPERKPLDVQIEGTANGAPVQAALELESPLRDAVAGEAVRLDLDASTDGASISLDGSIAEPATLGGVDLALGADVESLDALQSALGIELPSVAPANLAATITSEGDGYVVTADGSVDGEPITARLDLDASLEGLSEGGPVTLDLDAAVGGAEFDLSGSVNDIATLGGADLTLEADIESLDGLETLLGRDLAAFDSATLSASVTSEAGGTGLSVRADGEVDGESIDASLDLDTTLAEALAGEPVTLDLDAAVGGARVQASGKVDDLRTLEGGDLELDIDIDSLMAIERLAGVELPDLEPASLTTTVNTEGGRSVLRSNGTVGGEPASATLAVDASIEQVLAGQPAQLDLDASVGGASVRMDGRVENLATASGIDLSFDVDVASLDAIETLIGTELPDLEPATLNGTLLSDGDEYIVRRFDLAAVDSTLQGDLRANPTTEPPTVYANLISRRLEADALLEAFGIETPEETVEEIALDAVLEEEDEQGEAQGPLLSPEPLPVDAVFGSVQGAVSLRVQEIVYAALPLESFDANVELAPELVTLTIDRAALADGDVSGTLELEPVGGQGERARAFDARLALELGRVRVGRFVPDVELLDDLGGPLGGQVELWVSGNSVATLAGSLDGGITLLMGRGELDALLVELAGLDLFQSIGDLLNPDDEEFVLRCAYASLLADTGMVSLDEVVIDSTDTVFLARGTVGLGTETLDIALESHPKDPSLLSANTGVAITGTFAEPEVEIGTELPVRAAAAAALAVVAAPAAALLPFIEVGGAEDSGFCDLEGALDGDAG